MIENVGGTGYVGGAPPPDAAGGNPDVGAAFSRLEADIAGGASEGDCVNEFNNLGLGGQASSAAFAQGKRVGPQIRLSPFVCDGRTCVVQLHWGCSRLCAHAQQQL